MSQRDVERSKDLGPLKDTHSVIVGGGPIAMSISAMMALHGVEHTIVYPEQDDANHRYSGQMGEYRQFAALNDTPNHMLEHLAKFYEHHGIETLPVQSVMVFESEEDFVSYRKKFAGQAGVEVVDTSTLPFNTDTDKFETLYPQAIVQKSGAFNVNMKSFMEQTKRISKKYATHRTGHKVKNISTGSVTLDNGELILSNNVVIAAGPYSGTLLEDNKSNIPSFVLPAIRETYEIHGAPTATYELSENSPLHDTPMNVSFISNGSSRAFGIYEGGKFRVSIYDLDRDIDLEGQLENEKREEFFDNQKKISQLIDYKEKVGSSFSEDAVIEMAELKARNKELLGSRTVFKDMAELPKDVADQELFYLDGYAELMGITSPALEKQVAPYTTTNVGAPIIGRIPMVFDATPRGHGLQVAFAGNGGAYKIAFGPDLFSSIAGIAFQKIHFQLYGTHYPEELGDFNYRKSGNLFEASEPRNHIAAAQKKMGKSLVPFNLPEPVNFSASGIMR